MLIIDGWRLIQASDTASECCAVSNYRLFGLSYECDDVSAVLYETQVQALRQDPETEAGNPCAK